LGGIGVGFLRALGVGFVCPAPTAEVQLYLFLHRTTELGVLTRACLKISTFKREMVQLLLKLLLKQRILAVYHDFHCLIVARPTLLFVIVESHTLFKLCLRSWNRESEWENFGS